MHTGSQRPGAVLLVALCTVFLPGWTQVETDGKPDILRMTDEVLAQVSALRGLEVREPVGRELHSEASLRSYIAQRLREEYPGDMLSREQRLLSALELVPSGFDLGREVERLYGSQTAGYYDPQKKILYLSESLPASVQQPTLAHELTHALQDQHFHIGEYMRPDRARSDDDHQLALMGLVEGDATAVMLARLAGSESGDDWTETVPLLQSGLLEGLASLTAGSMPNYLIQVLNFPYRYGTPFVAARYRQGGWAAVSQTYSRLPESTEQILHPERYAPEEDPPTEIRPTILPPRLGHRALYYHLVLGEFVTRLVLEPGAGPEESERAADGWDGDQAALYTGRGADLLVWLSVWDSAPEAEEFLRALRKVGDTGIAQQQGERVIFVRGAGAPDDPPLAEIADALWAAWK